MPGAKERVLRRRIKSVTATKKITKAMELIAASRILRAQQQVAAARPYSELMAEVIGHLAAGGAGLESALLVPRPEIRRVGYVVITSDRGLAGAYNASIIRTAERAVRQQEALGRDHALVLVGRKAESYFRFRRYPIEIALRGMSDKPTYSDARRVASEVTTRFVEGELDQVDVVYTQFLSLGTQRPVLRRLMPVDRAALAATAREGPEPAYEFEPEPAEILAALLPRYVEARLYAAMLDAAASEHAARQRAMKSATDNAEELIVRFTRSMNRARQDAITNEIMEIVGGAEALRQARVGGDDLFPDTMVSRDILPEITTSTDPAAPRARQADRRRT